ncbi:sensor histidine kinase [Dactylosporangium sp. CA-139066]|uniref:sensor histidine kinase n=1 Tax=Dactylosporangium sp. CA-139066 TaxID=3239930 RepID=UPI003D91C5F0
MKIRRWPTIPGLVWVAVWTFALIDPLSKAHTVPAVAGLIAFELVYVYTAAAGFDFAGSPRSRTILFAAVAVLGTALAFAYGEHWIVLLLFVAAAGMAVYADAPRPVAAMTVLVGALTAQILVGITRHADVWTVGATVVGTILSSLLVAAVRRMGSVLRELQRTREALAEAAVTEERLRFARDLHDLLGHTLSVIVVKAEVVRRLAERDPAAAAAQAADIEQIGRRALVEIREAVTGYRESGLTAELTRAKGALSTAGIAADVLRTADPLPDDADRLLAWVVREATTNVVRHSNAAHCEISVTTDEAAALLTVTDDGDFPATATPPTPGNGLRGLTERLQAAGGTLHAAARPGGGFVLTARLPL